MIRNSQQYVIGVDGGGTKTTVALADLRARILKLEETGSANPRNVGLERAVENVVQGINKVKRGKILSIFVGLPAVEEEYKNKKEKIKKEICQRIDEELSSLPAGRRGSKIKIGSDQIVAFRAGSDEREGVVVIAGTGCVVHGWHGKMEAKASGWGWVADEGSGFWAGQRACQEVLKDFDGRSRESLLTKLVRKELKIKKPEDLLKKIYTENPVESISYFSILCDEAAEKGDNVARKIMIDAGKEVGLTVKTVIQKLKFKKEKFPVVLVGGMFKSKLFLEIVKSNIRSLAPKVKFVLPKQEPVFGAIKLAIEQTKI